MKKVFMVFALAATLCLFGCSGEKTSNDLNSDKSANRSEQNLASDSGKGDSEKKDSENKIEIKATMLPDKIKNRTEIDRYSCDVDGDGEEETVVLLTDAECGTDGKLVRNDGQEWFLYVNDNESNYVLLDEYVQNGDVNFDIADYYTSDGTVTKIIVTVSTGSKLCITSYSCKDGLYTGEVLYDTGDVTDGGINRRYSSVPER